MLADRGLRTIEIARKLDVATRTVRKWKARFRSDARIEALEDAPRTGRPSEIPIEIRCKLIQLACDRPDGEESPAPFRDVVPGLTRLPSGP